MIPSGVLVQIWLTKLNTQGIPEAPTFYPTEEEFADPLSYINKIREHGEKWVPTFLPNLGAQNNNTAASWHSLHEAAMPMSHRPEAFAIWEICNLHEWKAQIRHMDWSESKRSENLFL